MSGRHLSRRFHVIFGTGPKRFARMARLENVLAVGVAWTNPAHACSFVDQAHMIDDARAILGASSEHGCTHPSFSIATGRSVSVTLSSAHAQKAETFESEACQFGKLCIGNSEIASTKRESVVQ